ncbi:MAG: sodium/proton-translocating pyrophosphatase, partial [Syntrophales bacterium]|nr:sodium/proton-translocating pyrophosphatase [Syntrophales bacterium]
MMRKGNWSVLSFLTAMAIMMFMMVPMAFAGEADIKLPDLSQVSFMGGALSGIMILNLGLVICAVGMIFGWMQYVQTKNLPAHQAMLDVSQTIWETCKTYVLQQGKFLAGLWVLIAICMVYYFGVLSHTPSGEVVIILICSIVGILGSYGVAWFGIRINTVANSRAAFASLSGDPLSIVNICLRSGMSVGLLLVSIELFFMIIILAYIPKELSGPCFIGFAIGESLGASALRICGGIFTKIADIGSDLMKIIFHLPEDDPKNPGVIADCTGDNAGDSVGPTADGFETYGVTGVALIAFIALALADNPAMGGKLVVWIFAMRILMIITSLISYFVNDVMSKSIFSGKKDFNFEHPLTNLVWITSIVSIIVTFVASYVLLADLPGTGGMNLWLALSIIISCGTIAGALIPEFTKVFTSTSSRHCDECVNASRQGGASLNILSGLVAGNFSAFWEGLTILLLMFVAYLVSQAPAVTAILPDAFKFAAPVFAFGLVAFGFL